MASRPLLLVPSAKLVPTELQAEFGAIPSALVPLDGRPALRYLAEPYLARGVEVVVALHEEATAVHDYLDKNPRFPATCVDVGPTRSLGETVHKALAALSALPDDLVINFADTYVGDELTSPTTVACVPTRDLGRWTTLRIGPDGGIAEIREKADPNGRKVEPLPDTFVGAFRIGDVESFQRQLERALGDGPRGLDPFYQGLWRHFNAQPASRRRLQHVRDWRDFGHLETYYRTKRAFWVNKRSFNRIAIDEKRGLLTKTSEDEAKLRNEIQWYLDLPASLQYVAPRIVAHSLAPASVTMEYYGYPPLSDLYLFGRLELDTWAEAFRAIGHVLDEVAAATAVSLPPEQAVASLTDMYVAKTRERVERLAGISHLADLAGDDVLVDGQEVDGSRRLLDLLPDTLRRMGLLEPRPFQLVHGDFCLSNILFDRRQAFVRVIDPRGRFGSTGNLGDPLYELAKLAHSLEGDYDLLLNGLFGMGPSGANRVVAHRSARHQDIVALFHRWLLDRVGEQDYWKVKAIEALLFVSMVPLHADRPRAQRAFLLRGLEGLHMAARRTPLPRWEGRE